MGFNASAVPADGLYMFCRRLGLRWHLSAQFRRSGDKAFQATGVGFRGDGLRLVSDSTDGTLRLWNADSGQPIGAPLTGQTSAVHDVAWRPDGRLLATASADGTVRLWPASATPAMLCDKLTENMSQAVARLGFAGHRLHPAARGPSRPVQLTGRPSFAAFLCPNCRSTATRSAGSPGLQGHWTPVDLVPGGQPSHVRTPTLVSGARCPDVGAHD